MLNDAIAASRMAALRVERRVHYTQLYNKTLL